MPDLDVQWLLPDGAGGGPVDGGTARVPGAIPGDRVRYSEAGRRGRTVLATLDTVQRPSPHRVAPPCPWDAACGGCDLAAMAATARRQALARVVARAFGRDAPPDVVRSPHEDGYRARIKLALDGGRVGYRAPRSHDLVEVGTCGIARPEVRAALTRLRAWATPERTAGLRGVEIRSDGTRAVFAFHAARRGLTLDPGDLSDVALDGRALGGDPTLWLEVDGLRLRASPNAFYQVNLEVNVALVAFVRAAVAGLSAERVLDLYAGIGNLGLQLARDGVPVVAVEIEGQATADLRASAGALPVQVVNSAVERFDPSRHAFDVAVLDPPRAGAKGVLARLVLNRPRAIVYVACNPVAAARDCREAIAAGYRLTAARCFDLFPQTHHIETVIVLER